jgi:hypothetical protein
MGKNSTIQLSVYVKLSVTVALEQSVKNSIDSKINWKKQHITMLL